MTSRVDEAANLTFRAMTSSGEDFRLFLECFEGNGSPRTEDLLRWQYVEPPPNRQFADLAVTEPKASLAAVYAVFPSRVKLGASHVLGVQSLDTLTDKRFRGKGLFVRLAASLYARLEREGVALVYGFPNANSAHGFFSKLGWQSLGRVPFLLRPLRSGYLLDRLHVPRGLSRALDFAVAPPRAPLLASTQELRIIDAPNASFTDLWRAFSGSIQIAIDRDADYLRWRLRRPGETYRIVAFYEEERLIGYVLFGTKATPDGTVGKVMDLIYEPMRSDVGRSLIREAVRQLSERGAGAVWAWNLEHSPNRRVLRDAGFIALPTRLHPLELHFGARGFTDAAREHVGNRRNWYISLLDSDTD